VTEGEAKRNIQSRENFAMNLRKQKKQEIMGKKRMELLNRKFKGQDNFQGNAGLENQENFTPNVGASSNQMNMLN
jgi:hypothetical protein